MGDTWQHTAGHKVFGWPKFIFLLSIYSAVCVMPRLMIIVNSQQQTRRILRIISVTFENMLQQRALILLHEIVFTRQPRYLHEKLNFAAINSGMKIA